MSFSLTTPTPSERDSLARLFGQIASDAGVRVMEVYESDFETRTKADYSPVSDADERAEEVILARLEQELPGVPVLAEERAAREGVGERIWDAFILVYPVDGTKEFIQRKGDEGFGEGNFTALFKSMERDQLERGALAVESAE